ncbi:MAG: hypothetical protein H6881_08360 [Rhodobiaceae bacterium]|nr:hypothetical protein [Rhodobiaceae bacterium]MCC0051876.1 hypothetical protein [Rhodobiaceae bacterium]
MSEDWNKIAVEVADAIGEVGFAATLRKPGAASGDEYDPTYGVPSDSTITVIDDRIRERDQAGTLTGITRRVLTVAAGGSVPEKDDQVQVDGDWHKVIEVMPLAPGGVDLLYDVEIAS